MNRFRTPALISSIAVFALAAAFPSTRLSASTPPSGRAVLAQAVVASCPACTVLGVERRDLGGHIAEYTVPVRIGPGEHDRIRLHRVVKETAPFVPAHASRALFLTHGDIWPFDTAFLNATLSASVPDTLALPVFLAARGVDVWGIDLRWTQVAAGTTDLSFMANWGIETDARDVRLGIAIARLTRGLSGDGIARLNLLGWSRGGQIGYAALDAETQLPNALRQIKGFIPVDIYLKTNDAGLKAAACVRLGITQGQQASGLFADTSGGLLATIGQLGKTAPAGPSPIVPGFTNRQAALAAGSATYQFLPPGGAFAPSYHFAGGSFDSSGLPTGLVFQSEGGFFDFLTGTVPFEPLKVLADADAAVSESCPSIPVPNVHFDDHLAQIRVPVLYVGAGGGVGDLGVYTTTLLGSPDVSIHVVSLAPPAQRAFDIGHSDIFNAADAPTLFWGPIYDWLLAH